MGSNLNDEKKRLPISTGKSMPRAGNPILFTFLAAMAIAFCLPGTAKARPLPDSLVIQTNNIDHFDWIIRYCEICFDPRELEGGEMKELPYHLNPLQRQTIILGPHEVDQFIYLHFNIDNPLDSPVHLIFFPGVYFRQVKLFAVETNGEIQAPSTESKMVGNNWGYIPFTLLPHQKISCYVRVKSIRSHTSSLKPALIVGKDLNTWISYFRSMELPLRTFSFIVVGMLIMMICYATIHFLQTHRLQFLYYTLYATFMGLLFFLYAQESRASTPFNFFLEEWLDLFLQLTAYFFYFIFVRYFLETRSRYKGLDRLCEYSQYLILICLAVYSYFYFGGGSFRLLNTIENFSKYFLMAFGLIIVVKGIMQNDRVFKYVMSGNLMLILFSALSLLMVVFNWRPFGNSLLFNRSLFYYEAGVSAELIFFLLGLSYKNRKELVQRTAEKENLKLENKRKEFEKQIAILQAQQEERNRISRDIHDELGGGMTAIRLMSELAKERMKSQEIPEIEKISASANDLLTKMNAIVWSMSQSNDSISNLVAYIRNYAMEFFENTPIECQVEGPQEIPELEVGGEKRRNIFLSFKETLNNTLKHSGASQVKIKICVNSQLEISVQDNGKGFNADKLRQFGTGLQNIKKRMDSIQGRFTIESKDGSFTFLAVNITD